jgi:hypothetical protein
MASIKYIAFYSKPNREIKLIMKNPKYKVGQKLISPNGIVIDVIDVYTDTYRIGWISPKDRKYEDVILLFDYTEQKFSPYLIYNKLWANVNL